MILFRKMCRDFWQNKIPFFSIFLMAFLGLMIYVGMDGEVAGLKKYTQNYYEETNLLDICVTGNALTSEQESKIEAMPEIKSAELRLNVEGKAVLPNEPILQIHFLTKGEVSRMKIIEGKPYKPGMDGVWLDAEFTKKQGLVIGDVLTMKFRGMEFEAVIRGSIYQPEYVYFLPDANAMVPEYGSYGIAFLDAASYPGEKIAYNQIVADAKDGTYQISIGEKESTYLDIVKKKIEQELNETGIVISDKSQMLSYQIYGAEVLQHGAMAFFFPAVFLLIAALGIVTTMTRMTARQRTQIGTLKALGFSKRKITIHYVFYGIFLSATGAILGAVVGYFTIPDALLTVITTVYLVPGLAKEFSGNAMTAVVLAVFVSGFVSFLACAKELKSPPAETLKPALPGKINHTAMEKSRLWLSIGFSSQWNIRDIWRNKIRTFMGMAGVIGCSMLLLWAFGCLDTVNAITKWMYGELMTSRGKIIMEEGTPYTSSYEYAKQFAGQLIQESGMEIESQGKRKSASLTVLDQGNFMHYQDESRRSIRLPENGISISYKLAQGQEIEKGDFIKWRVVGEEDWEYSRVEEIYRTPSPQGITMSREAWEELNYVFTPTYILTNKSLPDSLTEKNDIAGIQDIGGMMNAMLEQMELMYMMVGILILAAVVLGVVVMYNLGVLSYVEKTREIATLKVLGFSYTTIRRILQKQNLWVTTAGIAVGLPLGLAGLSALFGAMPDSMDYMPVINLPSYLYAILGTYLVSMSVNAILSGRIKDIDMVDALKGSE